MNKNYVSENESLVKRITERVKSYGNECNVINRLSDLDWVDVLFVLGGDGTILRVTGECARKNVKIIGINYGHVGFLAEFEPERLDSAIKLVCEGNYNVQRRVMLEVVAEGKILLALNDVVLQRNTSGENFLNTVALSAQINGENVDKFLADGIIISTPTGSTAYSLSAGGSVLAPDLSAFIMTPICAHTLHTRPIVFGDDSFVTVNSENAHGSLTLIVDGRKVGDYPAGSSFIVRKSQYTVDFITNGKKDFFNKLQQKLSKWGI